MPPVETSVERTSTWRVRLAASALLLAVFSTGAVAGVAGYRWVLFDTGREEMPPPPEELGFRLRTLGLTTEQETSVRKIFDQYRPELDAVLRETFPKVRAVQARIDADIAKVLTVEQRQKFLNSAKPHGPPNFHRNHGPEGFRGGPQPPHPPGELPPVPLEGPFEPWNGPRPQGSFDVPALPAPQ
jgi:Spy/CpxP family protein refolding chaperone